MSRKSRIIFRVLAAMTLFEAAAGALDVWTALHTLPLVRQVVTKGNPRFDHALHSISWVNLLFVGLLLLSSVFLWKLQRKGLIFLICTLGLEAAYFITVSAVAISANAALLDALAYGNGVLGVQFLTAYPIVAVALIFAAYHYLGSPSRKPD